MGRAGGEGGGATWLQGAPACSWRAAAHGHTRCMKALLVSHSPPLVHPLQLSSWSLHTVMHTCAAWPVTLSLCVTCVCSRGTWRRGGAAALGVARRTPHESGHSFITARGLLTHSPASAQISHCVEFLSAHLTPSHTPQLFGHSLYLRYGGGQEYTHAA